MRICSKCFELYPTYKYQYCYKCGNKTYDTESHTGKILTDYKSKKEAKNEN